MLTFIAFALTIAGCVNWLLIGLLQYDFVAGIFGYQGSVFSRLIYIVIGVAAAYLVVRLFIDKGSIHVWGAKKKRLAKAKEQYATTNVEASKEERRRKQSGYNEHADYSQNDYDERRENHDRQLSLFDEHFDDK